MTILYHYFVNISSLSPVRICLHTRKCPKCSAYPRPHHAEGVYIIKPQGNARYPRDDIRRTSCGDDMPSLREPPKLVELASENPYAAWIKKSENKVLGFFGRVFACGENSHALRLASKLADLRAANADRRRLRGSVRIVASPANRKATPKGGFSVVSCVRFRCRAV